MSTLLLAVCLGWSWLQGNPSVEPKVEVTRLVVARPSVNEPREKEARMQFFDPNFLNEGIALDLTVSVPECKIVHFDKNKSRLLLKDDRGKVLPLATEFDRKTPKVSTKFSPDKRWVTLTLGSHSLPPPGTAYIHLVGQLVFDCAMNTETSEVIDLPERQGGQIKVGPLDIKLLEAKLIREGDRQFRMVRLDFGRQGKLVGKIEFADALGKLVEVRPVGTMTVNGIESRDFRLDPQITRLRIRVTFYSQAAALTLPIDIKVGAGL